MQLTLTVLRCPPAVAPETRTLGGGEFTIGRGPGVDWILGDVNQMVSRRHCTLLFRAGAWQVIDDSANGTFPNHDEEPIGKGNRRDLRDHDRLRIGPYELEVHLVEDAAMRPDDAFLNPKQNSSYADDPFTESLWSTKSGSTRHPGAGSLDDGNLFGQDGAAPGPFGHDGAVSGQFGRDGSAAGPFGHGGSVSGARANGSRDFGGTFASRTQDDHSSALDDAMRVPISIGQMPMRTGGTIPADDLLPEGWENDLLAELAGAAPIAPEANPPLRPVLSAQTSPAQGGQAQVGQAQVGSAQSQVGSTQSHSTQLGAEPTGRATPSSATSPANAASLGDMTLLATFLAGAGLPDANPSDPALTMQRLGETYRALVSGLRAVLIARAAIKSEFRIEQTMIRPRGNNPLKFSANDDDAVAALLGVGRHTDMAPAKAVEDALRDIRLHELASMAAMQSAVRALLQGLDPQNVKASVAQGGGRPVLPHQKKARAWEAYEALHARISQALSDDFDSVFGKAFARAYEEALDELSARDRP